MIHNKTTGKNRMMANLPFYSPRWMGVLFTFFIAFLGFLFAFIPGFQHIGQLACGILIAIIYRQFFGYPEALRSGIEFSSKRLLRFAIILYGLKLNIHTVLQDGIGLLLRDLFVIILVILFTVWLAKVLGANKMISLLLGVGTGVCGAAAIATIAPIVKAKEEDTAISVGIIALIGTIFAILYTVLRPFLPLDDIQYGIWSGTSLHEVAHVALATAPASDDAFAIGMLAKLGRVFLLIPLSFFFIYIIKRKQSKTKGTDNKVEFPWFLIGFMILSIIGSYGIDHLFIIPEKGMEIIFTITTWILSAAMIGLGLNVSLHRVRTKALKPLITMTITSVLLSVIVYFIM